MTEVLTLRPLYSWPCSLTNSSNEIAYKSSRSDSLSSGLITLLAKSYWAWSLSNLDDVPWHPGSYGPLTSDPLVKRMGWLDIMLLRNDIHPSPIYILGGSFQGKAT